MHGIRIVALAVLCLAACTRDATPPPPPPATGPYADAARWLCGPDAITDHCATADLSATRIDANGTTAKDVVPHVPSKDPKVDCFYVYPTVRFEPECGNAVDFENVESEIFATVNQAARFSSVCRVFAPLYRQRVRCPVIDREAIVAQKEIDAVAYDDVHEAFEHYLRQHNAKRPFVLLGHSQGADILARLVRERIARDPTLRKRMRIAILPGGDIFVPHEGTTGGTLGDVPLCRSEEETGCAIAYRTFSAARPPIVDPDENPPREEMACTNPAALGGGRASLSASYLPNPPKWKHPLFDLGLMAKGEVPSASTPHLVREGFWTAECKEDARGQTYLEIDARGREDWIDYDAGFFNPAAFGTHPLDIQFALGDLIEAVRTRTKSMDGENSSR